MNNAGQYEVVFFQRIGLQGLTRQLGASIFLLLFFCGTQVQAGEPTPEIDDFLIQIRIALECMNVHG
jgi:hypothetical protein